MNTSWLKILLQWQDKMLRHALTFSFLVGVLKEYSKELQFKDLNSEESVRMLINQIRNTPIQDAYFHVYRCPDIGILVIRKVSNAVPSEFSIGIESDDNPEKTYLYVTDGIVRGSKSPVEDLVGSILQEAGIAIEEKKYSRNGQNFSNFSDYDVNAICRALA
jgi:hypothetical protein